MRLELDRLDMTAGFDDTVPCSKIRFKHFDDVAQGAIRAVGSATFYEFDRQNYNKIYPPSDELYIPGTTVGT